jgi:hypothetical protein
MGQAQLIRSMDTSAPYVYALKEEYVDGGQVIKRDIDAYFTSAWTPAMKIIAARNVALMDGWIDGTQTPSREV